MFIINGFVWRVLFVDPNSYVLYDFRNNIMSVATTDLYTHTIYISWDVDDLFLIKILKHEIYHCYEFSKIAYDLPTVYEEIVADFIATYGEDIINLAYDVYDQITYYE